MPHFGCPPSAGRIYFLTDRYAALNLIEVLRKSVANLTVTSVLCHGFGDTGGQQIALIVFLPMIAGYTTQQALIKRYGREKFQQVLAPRFPGFSTLGVLGIVFIAMALKAEALVNQPDQLLNIIVPLLLLYTFNYLLSTLVGKLFLPRGDAIALVYGTVMRNLSIALAVAINAFGQAGSDAALVIAIAYIIQVQSAAWYVKFTPRLFGPSVSESKTAY